MEIVDKQVGGVDVDVVGRVRDLEVGGRVL